MKLLIISKKNPETAGFFSEGEGVKTFQNLRSPAEGVRVLTDKTKDYFIIALRSLSAVLISALYSGISSGFLHFLNLLFRIARSFLSL
ncbi:MAG: hypothetical protein H7A25_15320 [Leptospiraceae bacterium]|nr:hypothetical protein [Leptospiraceae bacterium]MCP5501269.1 hypothetical protein [Leptospiraceae bacterium]